MTEKKNELKDLSKILTEFFKKLDLDHAKKKYHKNKRKYFEAKKKLEELREQAKKNIQNGQSYGKEDISKFIPKEKTEIIVDELKIAIAEHTSCLESYNNESEKSYVKIKNSISVQLYSLASESAFSDVNLSKKVNLDRIIPLSYYIAYGLLAQFIEDHKTKLWKTISKIFSLKIFQHKMSLLIWIELEILVKILPRPTNLYEKLTYYSSHLLIGSWWRWNMASQNTAVVKAA